LNCEGSRDLSKYQKDQEKIARRPFKTSNEKELRLAIENSDIILVGDFHTFDQNNRNFQRIISKLITKDSGHIIAVEFIHHRFQHIVDAFLSGELTEIEFLEEINYKESWHFPWPHYKEFFELAKKYQLKVVAINSDGTLAQRDIFAAEIIRKHSKSGKVFVFIGELHIVEDKLPYQMKLLDKSLKTLIIHQNLDQVFWRLKPNEHIIRFNDHEYSLQNSPPWIKYESLNYWFDYMEEDPEFDIHEYIMNQGIFLFNSNIPENFLDLCKRISDVLHLSLTNNEIADFNLYDHQSLDIVLNKVLELKNKHLEAFLEGQLINGNIFSIPGKKIYFCPTYSFNRLVLIAGIHLYQIITEKNGVSVDFKNNNEAFIYFTLKRTFSFFISKIINPFRKCDRYQDIKDLEIIQIIDSDDPDLIKQLVERMSLDRMNTTARIIGSYLGDLLYEHLYLNEEKQYRFILDIIMETKFELDIFYFVLRSILQEGVYHSQSKRVF
jgi:hypothetical protein